MSNKRYYQFPSIAYTDTAFAVANTTLVYMLNTLYADEIALTSMEDVFARRMFRADIEGGGTDIVMGDVIEQVEKINHSFPVTAYNVGELQSLPESYSYPASSGLVTDYTTGGKIKTWPVMLPILFTSIFTTPHDYMRAHEILRNSVQNTLTRLAVPIVINGETYYFPADLSIEIARGEYPFQMEKQKAKYEIYDLNHVCNLTFYEMAFDNDNVHFVQDIQFYIESFTGSNDINDTVLICTLPTITIPEVSSTTPVDQFIGHPITDPITITFSEPVRPETFMYDITPYVSLVKEWDALGQTVTLRPYGANWSAATLYNFTVYKQLLNGQGSRMQDDYSFTFTTA